MLFLLKYKCSNLESIRSQDLPFRRPHHAPVQQPLIILQSDQQSKATSDCISSTRNHRRPQIAESTHVREIPPFHISISDP